MKPQLWLAASLIGLLTLSACSRKSGTTGPIINTEGPTAISDLHVVSADTASVLIAWTAPGDNGAPAASYELRYRGGTGFDWSAMTPVSGLSAPKAKLNRFGLVGLGWDSPIRSPSAARMRAAMSLADQTWS